MPKNKCLGTEFKKKRLNGLFLNSGNPHDLPVPGRVPILSENVSTEFSGGPKLHSILVPPIGERERIKHVF
jgi:hypothetical protein